MIRILKGFIFIIIILVILVLGQQPYFRKIGQNVYQKIEGQGRILWQKGEDFLNKNILHRVTSEIEKREQIAKEEIKEQTKEATQTIWQRVKNYISGLFSNIFNQAPQESK
ncbi:hypothetical protein KKG48_00245 [Patescibacteria group bacterium]|nr:hypothetical protein [Patescibacteria group bacterium]